MRELDALFTALSRSSFRRKFHLVGRDREYLERHGLEQVLAHGQEFITTRLAPARPTADGRQTPWTGHPVFVAQHATATCCRNCLRRWHGIERFRPLTPAEIVYVLGVLRHWLETDRGWSSVSPVAPGDGPRPDKSPADESRAGQQRQQRLFSAE